eukprot:11857925-Heterocapsa_arctica.AAC.1
MIDPYWKLLNEGLHRIALIYYHCPSTTFSERNSPYTKELQRQKQLLRKAMLLRRPNWPRRHVGMTPSRDAPVQQYRHAVRALDEPVTEEHATAKSLEDQEMTNPRFEIVPR